MKVKKSFKLTVNNRMTHSILQYFNRGKIFPKINNSNTIMHDSTLECYLTEDNDDFSDSCSHISIFDGPNSRVTTYYSKWGHFLGIDNFRVCHIDSERNKNKIIPFSKRQPVLYGVSAITKYNNMSMRYISKMPSNTY